MSTQTQVNQNFQEYILYYCNSVNADTNFYDYINLSDVCSVGFDSNSPPQLVISGWLIGGYSAPSNATLLTYVFSTVDTFFNNFYVVPAGIQATQPYAITTSDLGNVINHSFMTDYVVLDTTTHELKVYTGSSWVTLNSVKSIFSLTPAQPVDVSNTTTWTSVLGAGLGSLVFPANSTKGGTTLNIVGASRGNIDNGTTIGFALENAGNLVGLFYTNSSGGVQNGVVWMHVITLVINGDGSAYMNWVMNSFNGSGPVFQNSVIGSFWDPTVDNTLDFQAHWDTATLTNTVNQQFLTIEQLF